MPLSHELMHMSDGVSDRVRLKYAFTIREAYSSRDILYIHVHVKTINVPLSRMRRKINVTDQHSRMRRCSATFLPYLFKKKCFFVTTDTNEPRKEKHAFSYMFIVRFLCFLNSKFQAPKPLLWLCSLVCVQPCRAP